MSYKLYYLVSPARWLAYLLDMSRQPYGSCGLALVMSFLRIDALRDLVQLEMVLT